MISIPCLLKIFLIFNWRIIASPMLCWFLPNNRRISSKRMYVPLLELLPTSPPPHPLGWMLHRFKSCFLSFFAPSLPWIDYLSVPTASGPFQTSNLLLLLQHLKNITIKSKKLGYKWPVEIMPNKTHSHYTMHALCVLRCFSRVRLCATLWTVARQAPLSMGILQARILE